MGAAAGAGGTWAPSQKRAANGRRRRSGRHVGVAAEAGGTWAPPQERSARGRCCSGTAAVIESHGVETQ